ncbi:unnamed protein product [Victoria cruziana]
MRKKQISCSEKIQSTMFRRVDKSTCSSQNFHLRRYQLVVLHGIRQPRQLVRVATFAEEAPCALPLSTLTGISNAMSIADVTINACIARSSIEHPALASDMQSLCGFVSSSGAILGYSTSGMLVHTVGAQVLLARHYFRWVLHAIGSIVGVVLYHKLFKEFPFRTVIFFAHLLYGVSGIPDLTFVLRLNLKLGVPDYVFIIMEEMCSRIISRIRWMPMIILSTRSCPLGIEGTFFALLMCMDSSTGSLSSKWGGSLVLQLLKVTRTDFRNLWLALLIRNLLRISTLALIFFSAPKQGQPMQCSPMKRWTPPGMMMTKKTAYRWCPSMGNENESHGQLSDPCDNISRQGESNLNHEEEG